MSRPLKPFEKKESTKKHPKWLRCAVVAATLVSAALGGYAYYLKTSGATGPAKPKVEMADSLKDMRDTPEAYTLVERDGSDLFKSLNEDAIEAIGVNDGKLLVLTTTGDKYFVNDQYSFMARAALDKVLKDGKESISLAFLTPSGFDANQPGMLERVGRFFSILASFTLFALIVLLVWMLRREFTGGARLLSSPPSVTFDGVIGIEEAKTSLKDVVHYLKDPSRYEELGARPPAGVLLLGGPGVGKTLLAKAVAGECGANFISTTGSDFTSKYVGVGVQKVKTLFDVARKNAPCIIFIDEIDGIARRTNAGSGAAESEGNRIINQVLVEMDGFSGNAGVIVIGATNLAENLDPALLREGRFDRQVQVKLPDVTDRAKVLEHYAKGIKLNEGEPIDYEQLARTTTGFSPATLAYVINHAALLAARDDLPGVGMRQLFESIETAHMGELNGGQRALSREERYRIAAHEAGHAIVAAVTGCGVVEKVTILPRGGALGVTLVTQAQDKVLHLQSDIENRIAMLLAGRNAELAIFNEASSGAAHDLQESSRLAMSMVARFGFGAKGELFSIDALPAEHAGQQVTEAIKQANQLLNRIDEHCKGILAQYRTALVQLTEELLARETVPGDRVLALIAPPRPIEMEAA